ncbi:MAG: hypothetical protein M1827_006790 [Pycnora praestabilis]|nr:MAG: hypothetical protein M1827_006790 [Pycnora praestabilis]
MNGPPVNTNGSGGASEPRIPISTFQSLPSSRNSMAIDNLLNPSTEPDNIPQQQSVEYSYYDGIRQSSSSESEASSRERRDPRPKYKDEEIYFIWYYREDLGLDWPEVTKEYNARFAHREEGGIQCRYYRYLDKKGIAKLRQRPKSKGERPGLKYEYGLKQWLAQNHPGLNFTWMREEDRIRSGPVAP